MLSDENMREKYNKGLLAEKEVERSEPQSMMDVAKGMLNVFGGNHGGKSLREPDAKISKFCCAS